MKIFDKDMIEEMKNEPDGVEYIFEYVDSGRVYQDVAINYDGAQYFKSSKTEYEDAKTGAPLASYNRYDKDNNLVTVVRNSDGTVEIA